MYFRRRKKMSNSERIENIITKLRKNKNYRVFSYNAIFGSILLWLPLLCLKPYIGLCIGCIIALCTFAIYTINIKRNNGKVLIEANFHEKEMILWGPSRRGPEMGIYIFVAYYVKENKTYRFRGIVLDEQEDLYFILKRLREDGIFPKIKILVNPKNYKKYKMLGYEYIENLMEQNMQLVADELDEYYDTSDKWKYIKA